MQNSWKGLVVGGLTGAFVGIALDLFAAGAQQAARGAELARDHVPDATEWLQGATEDAAKRALDSDASRKVTGVVQRMLHSDLAASANATALGWLKR